MGVISRAIPTLLRGISQSSDALKQADHADIQDNADSNPVLGLTKRSGFQFVTALQSSTLGNVHIQTINRDLNERYVAVFSNGNVRVFVDRLVGDQGLRTYTKEDEIRARAILMETDLANADHNLLRGDPSLTSIFDTYNPSSALIR